MRERLEGSRANLRTAYALADEYDRREGLVSYQRYNAIMRALAKLYSTPLELVVAVFAATSPSNDYMGNLRSTVTLLDGFNRGRSIERLATSSFGHCKLRAWDYLCNRVSFVETVKGPKIRSFYFNILDPEGTYHVTVDGHMVGCWSARRMTMKEAAVAKWNYERVAHDFRAVAFEEFILPSQLQATLWFTWKRINRVIYDGQRDLFKPPDDWGLRLDVEKIRPYAERRDGIN
jgi:hypothetical protein